VGAGVDVDPAGQLMVEAADHRDMLDAEFPGALGGGGRGQHRREGFAGQRAAPAQIGGVAHPPAGFGAADQRPLGERMRELAAQLLGRGLLLELVDQGMLAGGQAPSHLFVALQQRQPLASVQHLGIQADDSLECGIQRIEGGGHRFAIRNDTQTHTDETKPTHRQKTPPCDC
jgi:hypothetical protein